MKYKIILILLTIIFFTQCKVTETVDQTKNRTLRKIEVGQGGGFTGAYTAFVLREDGKVYKHDFKYDRDVFYKELDPAASNEWNERIDELGLESYEYENPGNMSKYIKIKSGNIVINYIVWDSSRNLPSNNVIQFYEELYKLLSELEVN